MSKESVLAGNEPHLTDAEQEALKGFDEDGREIAAPPAETPAEVETPPADPAAAPVAAPAATPEPVVEPPAAEPAPANTLTSIRLDTGAPRDYKAELKALKEEYAKGDMDDEAYEERSDEIKKASWKSEISEDLTLAQWKMNATNFLQYPENQLLMKSVALQDGWMSAMQQAANRAAAEGRWPLDDLQLMKEGRDLLYQEAGLTGSAAPVVPPAPAVATPAAPPAPRPPDLSKLPPNIGQAPGAAPSGAKETAETLAGKDIFEIESQMARMTDAQADEMLRQVAGGFAD